jgi:hypothetical protein
MKTSVVLFALRLLVKLIPGEVDDRLLEYVENLLDR